MVDRGVLELEVVGVANPVHACCQDKRRLLRLAESKRLWWNATFKHFSVENSLTISRVFEYVCAHFRGAEGSVLVCVVSGRQLRE